MLDEHQERAHTQRPERKRCAAGVRKRRAVPAWSVAAGIAILFPGMAGYAKITDQWNTNLAKQVYLQLVENASEQEHPIPSDQ